MIFGIQTLERASRSSISPFLAVLEAFPPRNGVLDLDSVRGEAGHLGGPTVVVFHLLTHL